MTAALAYLATIVCVNVGFSKLPLLPLPDGGALPSMAIVAGAVFVLRDFVQVRIGHGVVAVMAVGVVLSWWLASPAVALASGLAFAVAESVDWAVFSWSRASFQRRVLLSSIVAVPLDTAVFLGVAFGSVSPLAVMSMSAIKLLPAIVWLRWR
jgi:uncharacterized PurR-regulated membrane protein YhhQ (DUF165 family)